MKRDPGLYTYSPLIDRPAVTWPGGARVALWIAPNLEFYELEPVGNAARQAWPRPVPDVAAYSHRDFGNRVGHWRLMALLDRYDIRGSVSLNVAVCEHHPEIIESCVARGWEFYSHGVYNTRYTYGMSEEQERELILDCMGTVKRQTGQELAGWLSPALSNTENTMDLLAECGVKYTCDLFHDDQPQPVNVRSGRLISMPYSLELNDFPVFAMAGQSGRRYAEIIMAYFDQLYHEGELSGRVMCIPTHPYLLGQPHRMAAFEEAIAYIAGHDNVWFATGREIADHYCEHHYERVARTLAAHEAI